MDWNILDALHATAKARQMSWSIHFSEADDRWHVEISSAAPSECFIGRSCSFWLAVQAALTWLDDCKPAESSAEAR